MAHLDLEGLKEIFMEEGKPYWWLYSGTTTKGAKRGGNDEVADIQESCDLLVRRLELYGAGVFTIATAATANLQNARRDQHVVKLGASQAASSSNSSPMLSGISGLIQVMELAERFKGRGDDDIAGAVESAMVHFQLEQKIKELQKENRELKKGGVKERMAEMAMQRMPAILDRLLGQQHTAIAGELSTVGIADETEELEDASLPQGEASPNDFSLDQLIAACNLIAEALPHWNVNQILWILAKFIQANPEQAEAFLKNLA